MRHTQLIHPLSAQLHPSSKASFTLPYEESSEHRGCLGNVYSAYKTSGATHVVIDAARYSQTDRRLHEATTSLGGFCFLTLAVNRWFRCSVSATVVISFPFKSCAYGCPPPNPFLYKLPRYNKPQQTLSSPPPLGEQPANSLSSYVMKLPFPCHLFLRPSSSPSLRVLPSSILPFLPFAFI